MNAPNGNNGEASLLDVWTKYGLTVQDVEPSLSNTEDQFYSRGYVFEDNPTLDIFGDKV